MSPSADRLARLAAEKAAAEGNAEAQRVSLEALRAAGKEAEITTQMLADLAEAQNEAATAALAHAKANNDDADTIARLREEVRQSSDVTQRYADTLADAREEAEKFASAGESLGSELAGMIPIIGGNVDYMDTFGGKLAAASVNAGSLSGGLGEVAGGFAAALNPTQLYTNIMSAGVEMIAGFFLGSLALGKELQSQTAEFNKATGMMGKYDDAIMSTVRANQDAGVSVAEANEAFQSLITTTTRFTKLAPSQQAALANTSAVLNELGVNSEVSAQGLQIMTTSLQMTAEQAESETRRIFTAAQAIGVAPAEMAADFVAMGDSLAAFGSDAVDVFIDLKEVAKETGIEMSSLLGIAEQFDTFEGAAGSVGKLNALLGGPFLNTIDMISVTEPAERMMMLQQAVNDAGTSFEDMNYYQRKAIASAMGLKDAAELGALMRGELEGMGGASNKTAKQLEELKEATKFTQTLADELEATKLAFVVSFKPLIDFFIGILNIMQDIAETLGPGGTMIVTIVTGLGLAVAGFFGLSAAITTTMAPVLGLSGQITLLTTTMASLATAMGAVDLAAVPFVPAIGAAGVASGAAGKHMLILGAAVALIGLGIGLAAAGLALFVFAFAQLEVDQMLLAGVALVGLAVGFAILISTLSGMAPMAAPGIAVIYAIGGAIALIGLGIALATAGMALLITQVAKSAEDFKAISEAFEAMEGNKLIAYTAAMTATAMVGMTPAGILIGAMAARAGGAGGGGAAASAPANIKVEIQGDLKKFVTSANARYVQKKDVTPGGKTPTFANGG